MNLDFLELFGKDWKWQQPQENEHGNEEIKNSLKELKEKKLKPITIKQIKKLLKQNPEYFKVYKQIMGELNADLLYKSQTHGINHNIRTSLFVLIIAIAEKIDMRDFVLALECAKYHDIGRVNDWEDRTHGTRSAEKLDFLNADGKYTKLEMDEMKTAIICHSINDNEYETVSKQRQTQTKQCETLFKLLKDADGLDRARLKANHIYWNFMRTDTAKRLIPFAHELYYNYKQYLQKVESVNAGGDVV